MSNTLPEVPGFSHQPYADSFTVGEAAIVYVTRMRQPVEAGTAPSKELLVGDVLRRTCALGSVACSEGGCQAPKTSNNEKLCSDLNLKDVTERLDISSENLIMVGVTANEVGFYDQLESYDNLGVNSVGIRELPGYNAFFARASDNVTLGARLADCGFAAIEFKDDEGQDVIGFTHLTRPNMQGESKLAFKVDGRPAGSFEYFLNKALSHYGGDIASVKVHLVAAVKAENFLHSFRDTSPEDEFPGWYEQGLLLNTSNPTWQPGDIIDPKDVWEPQYRKMVRYQIMRSGLQPEQLSEEDIIDPAELELGHASDHAGTNGYMPKARDAYLVMPRPHEG